MQVQESVNAANFLSVGAATNKKGGGDELGGADFASFLNASGKGDDKGLRGVSTEKELFSERSNAVSEETNANNKKETSDVKTEKKPVSTNSNNKVRNKLETDNVSNVDAVSEGMSTEDNNDIVSAIEDILIYIMNKFEVNIEDVQSNLDQMGMGFEELFSNDGLKSLFLNMESADVSSLLTDETLNANLEEFVIDVNAILEGKDVSFDEIVSAFEEELVLVDDFSKLNNNPIVQNEDFETEYMPEAEDEVNNLSKNDIDVKIEFENEEEKAKSSSKNYSKSDANVDADNKNTIIQNINNAVNSVEDVTPVSETSVRPVQIVDQIVEQIRVNINEANTSMEMQLYPEHLGRIQIHVISKDGVMTAKIAAETETARQAIEAGLNNLKESLQNQNLKVDAIEVMVSTTAFAESDQKQEQYQQQGTGKRGTKLGFFDGEDEDSADEIEVQKMQVEGSSVSYRA